MGTVPQGSLKDTFCPFETWPCPPKQRETTIYKLQCSGVFTVRIPVPQPEFFSPLLFGAFWSAPGSRSTGRRFSWRGIGSSRTGWWPSRRRRAEAPRRGTGNRTSHRCFNFWLVLGRKNRLGDSWFTWWLNDLPGKPIYFPKRTPVTGRSASSFPPLGGFACFQGPQSGFCMGSGGALKGSGPLRLLLLGGDEKRWTVPRCHGHEKGRLESERFYSGAQTVDVSLGIHFLLISLLNHPPKQS